MAKQPNILFLMTDQQRFDTVGGLGNPLIQTPALDRLVRDRDEFYVCVLSVSCLCRLSL